MRTVRHLCGSGGLPVCPAGITEPKPCRKLSKRETDIFNLKLRIAAPERQMVEIQEYREFVLFGRRPAGGAR
jgi:hypothetical protein